MKRTVIHLFIWMTFFLIALMFPAFVFAQAVGTVTDIAGTADILKAGAVTAVPLKAGDAVSVGDVVRTKSDGQVEITFIDKSVLDIGPRSRLAVEEYLFKPDDKKRVVSLSLRRGKMGFNVPKAVYPGEGSKFEMKTRNAVAGIRGTEGILISGYIDQLYIKVGSAEFGNKRGTVLVTSNNVGEVRPGKTPTARSFTPGEYRSHSRDLKPHTRGEDPSGSHTSQQGEKPAGGKAEKGETSETNGVEKGGKPEGSKAEHGETGESGKTQEGGRLSENSAAAKGEPSEVNRVEHPQQHGSQSTPPLRQPIRPPTTKPKRPSRTGGR